MLFLRVVNRGRMAVQFSRNISCHMCGLPEAMRVVSLKPPPASEPRRERLFSSVRALLVQRAAIIWGRWLICAMRVSCCAAVMR